MSSRHVFAVAADRIRDKVSSEDNLMGLSSPPDARPKVRHAGRWGRIVRSLRNFSRALLQDGSDTEGAPWFAHCSLSFASKN